MEIKPLIIAHRVVDERIDSEEKLKKLLSRLEKNGITAVEFDVRRTKDGHFVAFHDQKFPQLKKRIKRYRLLELETEAEKNGFSFLTMEQVLKLLPKNFKTHIDLKDNRLNTKKFAKIICDLGFSDRVFVSSFYPQIIRSLGRRKIKQRWILLNLSFGRDPFHFFYGLFPFLTARFSRATGIAPHRSITNEILIKKAHKRNFEVAVWTLKTPEKIAQFRDIGADYLIAEYDLLV